MVVTETSVLSLSLSQACCFSQPSVCGVVVIVLKTSSRCDEMCFSFLFSEGVGTNGMEQCWYMHKNMKYADNSKEF